MGFSNRSLSGAQKLDAEETRQAIFERDGYMCRVCGLSIYRKGTPQLGHRIGQGKMWRKKYGDAVIYHPLNMWSVCDLECNAKADISRNTEEREKLLDEIYADIDSKGS